MVRRDYVLLGIEEKRTMAKSKFSTEEQTQIKRIMKTEGVVRKIAIRHLFGEKAISAISKSKSKTEGQPKTTSAKAACSCIKKEPKLFEPGK
jgi:hypothetical protein